MNAVTHEIAEDRELGAFESSKRPVELGLGGNDTSFDQALEFIRRVRVRQLERTQPQHRTVGRLVALLAAASRRYLVRRVRIPERDFDVDAAFTVQQKRFLSIPAIGGELGLSV